MVKYLIHYTMDGHPVGVWNSSGEHFYGDSDSAERYGKAVLSGASFDDWAEMLEIWGDKTPNGIARWSVVENESDDLESVLIYEQDTSER